MIQLNWYKIFGESHQIPDGRTVTPTDDIQIWLHCADIWDKTYTTLVEVLADTSTLVMLMAIDNAVDYLVRSTTWVSDICSSEIAMKSIGASDYASTTLLADSTWNSAIQSSPYFECVDNAKVPIMTGANTPSGVASAGSTRDTNYPWKAFDNDEDTNWLANYPYALNTPKTEYIQYQFGYPIVVKKLYMKAYHASYNLYSDAFTLYGSNDGVTFATILTDSERNKLNNGYTAIIQNNTDQYDYHKLNITMSGNSSNTVTHPRIDTLQFYGRMTGGVQTWLRSANITDKTYTTLAEVLADSTTLSALMSNHNAVDYLVTAKGWATTICADSNAMTLIGQNNYCANTLLADATWCNAICNSTYFESVLNVKVPVMTDDNAPSGQCGCTSVYSYPAYKAFQAFSADTEHGWEPTQADSVNSRCWYQFTSAYKFYLADLRRGGTTADKTTTMDIISSTDGSTWNNEVSNVVVNSGANAKFNNPKLQVIINPSTADYWGIRLLSTTEEYLTTRNGYKVQFYGREDV